MYYAYVVIENNKIVYCMVKKLTVAKFDEFDKEAEIRQSLIFPTKLFSLNISPMKPTINSSKFC